MTYKVLLLILLLNVISPAKSAQQPVQIFTISPAMHYFNYTEYSDNDVELDKETGFIPGINLSYLFALKSNVHQLVFDIAYYKGEVKYDGQLQSGIPFVTNTDETLINYSVKYIFNWQSIYVQNVFFMLSQHQWDRNILGKGNVSGLFEIYKWDEIALGFTQKLYKTNEIQITAEIAGLYIYNPTIEIDFTASGSGFPELDLGSSGGLRLELFYYFDVTNNMKLSTSVYFETWDFGRSANKVIAGIGSIHEPKSETRHSGLRFNAEILF